MNTKPSRSAKGRRKRAKSQKEAQCFSEDKTTLYLKFRIGPEKDILACAKLLKNILALSNACRSDKLVNDAIGKNANRTRKIREGINRLVNRQFLDEAMVNKLVGYLRKGKIEKIETILLGEKRFIDGTTNFDQFGKQAEPLPEWADTIG